MPVRALTSAIALGLMLVGVSVGAGKPALAQTPQFGNPPSGEVPILFNDQHVYAKPDRLKQGRVLAALVRGSTVLVPLRSMFEQTGATVSYDPRTRTVDVSKPGADVQVTVGKPEVTINGESRPLDVPPEIYQGSVVVPVRVIAEGMGAYVLWVPDKRVVVVRYIAQIPSTPQPATPEPTAPPTMAPPPSTPVPTPPPTPAPQKPGPEFYAAGDALVFTNVKNEYNSGTNGSADVAGRAGIQFPLGGAGLLIEGRYDNWKYPNNQFVNTPLFLTSGARKSTESYYPYPLANNVLVENTYEGRVGVGVFSPGVYIVGGYLHRSNDYGYPYVQGFGAGLQLQPNLKSVFSPYGSVLYYPNLQAYNTLAYKMLRYQGGFTLSMGRSGPLFLDFGYMGDNMYSKFNTPGDSDRHAVYGGLGIHF